MAPERLKSARGYSGHDAVLEKIWEGLNVRVLECNLRVADRAVQITMGLGLRVTGGLMHLRLWACAEVGREDTGYPSPA